MFLNNFATENLLFFLIKKLFLNKKYIDAFIPECAENGEYESIQCYNLFFHECWCVDANGKEIEKTRKSIGKDKKILQYKLVRFVLFRSKYF
jgi:hypothetical protein